MKHNQFYKYLDKQLWTTLNDEINLYTRNSMLISHHTYYDQQEEQDNLLHWLHERWHLVLHTNNSPYHQYTIITMALLLHRYGWEITTLLPDVEIAVRQLIPHRSKSFERSSTSLLNLLNTSPKPLTRRPPRAFVATQLRAGDLISIHLNGCYHFAFVHDVWQELAAAYPVIEFYQEVHTQPALPLVDHQAQGKRFSNGICHEERYAVFGLNYLPDPANQIILVQHSYASLPQGDHLEKPMGLHVYLYFTQLNTYIKELFANPCD
ncbi:MAG: hypothetical protein GFH27_549283n24 [Chloroflexi bacterium AL-W]|nr:hypothetical protein [Chloroflexi bacterium AL-N1]NOK64856.1 hypothetical protein [Chloroflexi bacterium AL-N10]NOK76626.1 hypothetical protein [Chloroflexi bacterium AL-N5]NOK80145.1 hypothetical protein [Chloroflexi bacterium AL-W]NOK86658.1 hypothetical protein [Chloroflexi bacterium AL-N15]